MKKIILFFTTALFICGCETNPKKEPIVVTYPTTAKADSVDTYFGTEVKDPYRWLEDDRSPETETWVKEQNKVTFGYLEKIPFRDVLKNRLEKLWNYEKLGSPFKEGNYTYFYKNDGLQTSMSSIVKRIIPTQKCFWIPIHFLKMVLHHLPGLRFTKDGSLAAYMISEGGSDCEKQLF